LHIATWNVVLEPWIPNQDLILANLPTPDLDVLHLTEVWTPEARNAILNNHYVKRHWPHHYFPPTRQTTSAYCDLTDPITVTYAEDFIGCMLESGIDTRQAIEPWGPPIPDLCNQAGLAIPYLHNWDSQSWLCLGCLINELQDIEPVGNAPFEAINICGQNGRKYAFNGENGQLILSKYPIRDVKLTNFDAWVSNRVNIHATINHIRIGFGHWAYNVLEDINPDWAPFMYGATQINQSKDFVDSKDEVTIGDFNSGGWYQPDAVNNLFANGYVSVFGATEPDTCCTTDHADYMICSGDRQGPPFPSDHLLVKKSNRLGFNRHDSETFKSMPLMSDHLAIRGTVWKRKF